MVALKPATQLRTLYLVKMMLIHKLPATVLFRLTPVGIKTIP